MTLRHLLTFALFPALVHATFADDNAPTPTAHQLLKQRLAEESQPGATPIPGTPITPTATAAVAAPTTGTTAAADKNPIVAAAGPTNSKDTSTAKKSDTHAQPATVLPKVEVRKGRITKLDQDLAQEDQQIAREKKNAKPTELDKALNNSAIAKPLAMFGGESADYRKQVSNERVSLMEDEKDLIEAIAHARTKQEKAELQKQLDALREERRLLEQMQR